MTQQTGPSRRRVLRSGLTSGVVALCARRTRGRGQEDGGVPDDWEFPDVELFVLSDESTSETDGRTATTVTRGTYRRGDDTVDITG